MPFIIIEFAIHWGAWKILPCDFNRFNILWDAQGMEGKESSSFQYTFSEFIQIASKKPQNTSTRQCFAPYLLIFLCKYVGRLNFDPTKNARQKHEQERQRNLLS